MKTSKETNVIYLTKKVVGTCLYTTSIGISDGGGGAASGNGGMLVGTGG
jgi:hypothetical protein